MKNIFKYVFTSAILLGLASCEDDEQNITDLVQETVERGAVLRTIDFTDEYILDVDTGYSITLEEQDVLDGDLLEKVDITVTYTDNSTIAGNSSAATTTEVALATITAAEFTDGPFGLPRFTYEISIADLLSAVGLSSDLDIYVNDTFVFQEILTLTDGRVFNSGNAGGIIQGGFFSSPFQHVMTVAGGVELAFEDVGTNEVNIVPGAVNDGYSATLQVTEAVDNLWSEVQVFARYQDNTNEDDEDDLTTTDMLIGTFTRGMFTQATDDDGDIENTLESPLSFDLNTISGGVELADMRAGDEVLIRYAVINLADRAISSLIEPFTVSVPVVSCEAPPVADSSTFGVGQYVVSNESGVFPDFGATTDWGEGDIVEIVSLGGLDRQILDICYLVEFGDFCGPLDFTMNCDKVFAPLQAPGGGVGCGGAIFGQSLPGEANGSFDSTDDTEIFIALNITADESATTCPSVPYTTVIKLTRL